MLVLNVPALEQTTGFDRKQGFTLLKLKLVFPNSSEMGIQYLPMTQILGLFGFQDLVDLVNEPRTYRNE